MVDEDRRDHSGQNGARHQKRRYDDSAVLHHDLLRTPLRQAVCEPSRVHPQPPA